MNTTKPLYKLLLIALTAVFSLTAQATSKSDLAKEKRWENQIVDSLIVGESVKLNANGVEFLGLYAEPSSDYSKGAVIILHGIGAHPAWPDVVNPLRMELPDLGWHTLSLQMPILHNTAKPEEYSPLFPEVPARIKAGITFLKSKGINNIVLSGHSMGTVMASYYLATQNEQDIKVFAIISGDMGIPQQPHMNSLEHFRNIKNIHIVDVHGSDDHKRVLDTIAIRKPMGNKLHNKRYQPLKINGANHFYRTKRNDLVNGLNLKLTKIIKKQASQKVSKASVNDLNCSLPLIDFCPYFQ